MIVICAYLVLVRYQQICKVQYFFTRHTSFVWFFIFFGFFFFKKKCIWYSFRFLCPDPSCPFCRSMCFFIVNPNPVISLDSMVLPRPVLHMLTNLFLDLVPDTNVSSCFLSDYYFDLVTFTFLRCFLSDYYLCLLVN